jgi:hypothetical protein
MASQGPQDGNDGPRPGGYGPRGEYAPPPPPKKKHTGPKLALAGVAGAVVIAAATAGCGAGSSTSTTGTATATKAKTGVLSGSTNSNHPPAADVRLASCTVDDAGFATSSVVVVNHSRKTSNYIITVTFTTSSGQQLGTGEAGVNNLAPGQSSTPQEANSLSAAAAGTFTCKLAQVERYASAP